MSGRIWFYELRGSQPPTSDCGFPGDIYVDMTAPITVYTRNNSGWRAWNKGFCQGKHMFPIEKHPLLVDRYLWIKQTSTDCGLQWYTGDSISRLRNRCISESQDVRPLITALRNSFDSAMSDGGVMASTSKSSASTGQHEATIPTQSNSSHSVAMQYTFISTPCRSESPVASQSQLVDAKDSKNYYETSHRSGYSSGRGECDFIQHDTLKNQQVAIQYIARMTATYKDHLEKFQACREERNFWLNQNELLIQQTEKQDLAYKLLEKKYKALKAKVKEVADEVTMDEDSEDSY
ncbi:hypothetical protein BDQ12DRAFT_668478 [Crucibulum laeve]|uniref:Uncharacterized protein n=1 Tax=Crucibulum laeve TaxID=68775 RepID=A0A5C3LRS4_9AGAR|nr:hypothetical protein BDQ12DRAFT_668478 [Crucibulum laeve]